MRWKNRPEGSNWGDFGPDDQIGRLNWLGPEQVRKGVAEVREGPGRHRPVAFQLQGGSSARVVEASSGWTKIRVEGGLEGWVEDATLGRLTSERSAGSAETAEKRR